MKKSSINCCQPQTVTIPSSDEPQLEYYALSPSTLPRPVKIRSDSPLLELTEDDDDDDDSGSPPSLPLPKTTKAKNVAPYSTVYVSPRPTAKQVKDRLLPDNMELLRVVEGENVTANLAPQKKRKKASDTPPRSSQTESSSQETSK